MYIFLLRQANRSGKPINLRIVFRRRLPRFAWSCLHSLKSVKTYTICVSPENCSSIIINGLQLQSWNCVTKKLLPPVNGKSLYILSLNHLRHTIICDPCYGGFPSMFTCFSFACSHVFLHKQISFQHCNSGGIFSLFLLVPLHSNRGSLQLSK